MPEHGTTTKNKVITFLMSGACKVPVGGVKVIYEYANALAERGWQVRVVHPNILTHEQIEKTRNSLFYRSHRWLAYQLHRVRKDFGPGSWFKVSPKVEQLWIRTPAASNMPPSDIWIATWWYTANRVATYDGARAYLIQHLETFGGPEADVMATWKLPLRKIVISKWLEEVAHGLGEAADYIPNGLDFDKFGMDVAPENRDSRIVAMLYHESSWKGSADGLAALMKIKVAKPELKALLYGVKPRPAGLPSWVDYHQDPPQSKLRAIYNQASIFLAPSRVEGWGLTPAEALQCGAALAATDVGGHREFARHEETALLSPPKDPDAMAANVLRLIEDRELRLRLAHQGHKYIQQFTWDRSVNKFESVLLDLLAKNDMSSQEQPVAQSGTLAASEASR
jgi:glycosyltransferase involved in cell wall biosynthesis